MGLIRTRLQVKLTVVSSGVGAVTDADLELAVTTKAAIFCFESKVCAHARVVDAIPALRVLYFCACACARERACHECH